jgi:hypothetical protein
MTSPSPPEGNGFFARWSQRKLQSRTAQQAPPPVAEPQPAPPAEPPAPVAAAEAVPPPTLDELAALDYTADLTRFVARGVDETVRRAALRKLFADPQFNVMDGLDVYIDDYTTPSAVPPGLLARLKQLHDVGQRLDDAAPASIPANPRLAAAPQPDAPPELAALEPAPGETAHAADTVADPDPQSTSPAADS